MIEYSNIVRYENIEFEDYLKLKGFSHSFLKSNAQGMKKYFHVTDNVRIGSMVDSILTEPGKVDMTHELYPICKEIAFEIRKLFGDLINTCTKQVSYTATLTMAGMSMQTTGRLDLLLEDFAVVDLKITNEKNVDELIQWMGYENQLWHYSRMAKVKKAFLLMYSRPLKKIFVRAVDVTSDMNGFWANKIIDFGTANVDDKQLNRELNKIAHF